MGGLGGGGGRLTPVGVYRSSSSGRMQPRPRHTFQVSYCSSACSCIFGPFLHSLRVDDLDGALGIDIFFLRTSHSTRTGKC